MPLAALSPGARDALARLLKAPKFEILPLQGVIPQLAEVEPGTTLTVTASPAKGLEASVFLAERLRDSGFDVVIHLAARMVRDRSHLRRLMDDLRSTGVDRAFVISGDAATPGTYPDALSLLREMAEVGHHFREIGIAGYPQGHAHASEAQVLAALAAKAAFADYVTTQLCFDTNALRTWLAARRSEGMELPVNIGVAGAVEISRLLRVSARIGVMDARRFVVRHTGLIGRFLRPGGYRPESLLEQLAPTFADPDTIVRGLHVYTFNQLARTEAWRQRYLKRVRG